MKFVEFVEFLVRVARYLELKDAEDKGMPTQEGIEQRLRQIIDQILALVGIERIELEEEIDETSESDPDY